MQQTSKDKKSLVSIACIDFHACNISKNVISINSVENEQGKISTYIDLMRTRHDIAPQMVIAAGLPAASRSD